MRFTFALTLVATLSATLAFASGPHAPKMKEKKLEPATRYSGPTAIDLSNGMIGGNGTYGVPNTEYEQIAKQKKIVPGVNDGATPFASKESFMTNMNEQIMWGETAIANWKNTTSDKDEVKAYAKQAADTMDPLLGKLKDAVKSAKGAGQNDWASAEEGARKALAEFRAGYKGLHKNVTR